MLEAVEQVRREVDLGKGRTITATQLCERFGFVGNAQWTPVGELSGGERRRLQLLRLLMDEPNVLLLDEPTNDLDIDTLTALEDLLDGWPGTLLVVSHDRYFLERVCDRTVALLGDGAAARPARRRRRVPRAAPGRAAPAAEARRLRDAAGGDGGGADRCRRRPRAGPQGAGPAGAPAGQAARPRGPAARPRWRPPATDHERVLALDASLRALRDGARPLEERWLELAETAEP